jgi:hypothetical protein
MDPTRNETTVQLTEIPKNMVSPTLKKARKAKCTECEEHWHVWMRKEGHMGEKHIGEGIWGGQHVGGNRKDV